MPDVTLYEPATGRIRMTAFLSDVSHAALTQQEEPRIEGHFEAATHYVVDGAAIPRPANNTLLSGTLLNGLPQPCAIAINGTVYQCADDHADLSLPPGEYRITVSAWPYIDANFTLRV
jgi:hypothetical protein